MSAAKSTPDGYHTVQPYMIFDECAEAIAFYTAAFGAKERLRMPRPDGRVAHAEIEIGDSVLMMADEAPQMDAYSPKHFGGSAVSLSLYAADCDAVYAQAIAAGARGIREPADQPYGDRVAGVQDPFGYRWYIATRIQNMSAEEMTAQVEASYK